MGFGEKVARIVTGKSSEERAGERIANSEIRKKSMAEYYRTKEEESKRVARERAKAEADAKIRSYKQRYAPRKPMSSNSVLGNAPFTSPVGGTGLFNVMGGGQPQQRRQPSPQGRTKYVYIKKRSMPRRKVSRRRVQRPVQRRMQPVTTYQKFNVI